MGSKIYGRQSKRYSQMLSRRGHIIRAPLRNYPIRQTKRGTQEKDVRCRARPWRRSPAPISELNALRERSINHQVCPRGETGGGAGKKDHAAGNFLGFGHPAGGVQRQRLGIEVRHVGFDVLPDAPIEIGVPRRHGVGADALRRQFEGQPL
ncbi:hypothetical protein LCGC14_2370610, partial [marine sediment metagenome]